MPSTRSFVDVSGHFKMTKDLNGYRLFERQAEKSKGTIEFDDDFNQHLIWQNKENLSFAVTPEVSNLIEQCIGERFPAHAVIETNETDSNRIKALKVLFDWKHDKDPKNGYTSLHVATAKGKLEIVIWLLNHFKDIYKKAAEAIPPHKRKAYIHMPDVVIQNIIHIGQRDLINEPNNYNNTSLLIAAYYKHPDIVKVLVENGASMTLANNSGWNPLHAAVGAGDSNTAIVTYLADRAENVDQKTKDGKTALYMAAEKGHLEYVKVLAPKASIDQTAYKGQTPLHAATICGHLEIVKVLIRHGADVNITDKYDCSPLYFAASAWRYTDEAKRKYDDIAKELIQEGANINLAESHNQTPLFIAAARGFLELVKILVSKGADVKISNLRNETPLFVAAENGHLEVLQYLWPQSPDSIKEPNSNGTTPLLEASAMGHLDVVEWLDSKIETDDCADDLLYTAAQEGRLNVVEYLVVKHSHLINKPREASEGATPISVAAWKGHLDVVRLLADKGANVNASTIYGKTPLYFATANKHTAVVEYLANIMVAKEQVQ